jgi:ABC-type lipoprotein export system ATPase subunit
MAMSFEVYRLTYGYRPDVAVLREIDVVIPSGATTVVLGDSGSGKSTLLYLLGLLWDGRLTGEIIYHGGEKEKRYQELSPSEAATLRRTDFGFVLQSSYMLPNFTCAQNAAMPLALQGVAEPESTPHLRALVDALDNRGHDEGSLVDAMGKAAGAVSGGQRQRFALVRAIVHDPQVVFADEPFSSLDEAHTRRTLDLLDAWRRGEAPGSKRRPRPRTLILVCHDLDLAYERADHLVIVTREGKILGGRAFDRAQFNGVAALRRAIQTEVVPEPGADRDGRATVLRGVCR